MLEKHLVSENNKLKEKNNLLQDKVIELKNISNDNEKLKVKIKELLQFKEKCIDYDNLVIYLEQRNKQVENLNLEKKKFVETIQNLQREFKEEKEKFRQLEFEKKKIEFEFNDIRNNMSRIETQLKRKDNLNNISEVRKNESVNEGNQFNLLDMDKDSILYELDKNKEERVRNIEKELNELRLEKFEIYKNYKSQVDEIHILIEDKERLINELDVVKADLSKVSTEKDRLIIEKGKLEIEKEKIQIEMQKEKMNYNKIQNEKKAIENDKKEYADKIEIYSKEKSNFQKEIEVLKLQNHNAKLNLEKMSGENKNLHLDINNLHTEVEKLKLNGNLDSSNNKNANVNKKISPKNVQVDNAELTNMKKELDLVKVNLSQKDDMIKMQKEKIKTLETDNKNVHSQFNENVEKYNNDISKRSEDLEFFKRSYEEQKNRVNREHELISTSLYELALQFMSLKNELQKKMNSNSQMKNG